MRIEHAMQGFANKMARRARGDDSLRIEEIDIDDGAARQRRVVAVMSDGSRAASEWFAWPREWAIDLETERAVVWAFGQAGLSAIAVSGATAH